MFKIFKRKIGSRDIDNPQQKINQPLPLKNLIKLPASEHEIAALQGHKKNLERTFNIMGESPTLFEKKEIEDVRGELGRCDKLLLQKKHIMQTKHQFYEEVCTVHEKMINERTKAIAEIQGDNQSSDFLPAFADKMMARQNTLIEKVGQIKHLILVGEDGIVDQRNDITANGDFAHDHEAG